MTLTEKKYLRDILAGKFQWGHIPSSIVVGSVICGHKCRQREKNASNFIGRIVGEGYQMVRVQGVLYYLKQWEYQDYIGGYQLVEVDETVIYE